jgi:ACS family tartrate transporter-like MFS transporter
VSQIGAFIGPYAWGISKDQTGTYQFGLIGLGVACTICLLLTALLRRRINADKLVSLRLAPAPA